MSIFKWLQSIEGTEPTEAGLENIKYALANYYGVDFLDTEKLKRIITDMVHFADRAQKYNDLDDVVVYKGILDRAASPQSVKRVDDNTIMLRNMEKVSISDHTAPADNTKHYYFISKKDAEEWSLRTLLKLQKTNSLSVPAFWIERAEARLSNMNKPIPEKEAPTYPHFIGAGEIIVNRVFYNGHPIRVENNLVIANDDGTIGTEPNG